MRGTCQTWGGDTWQSRNSCGIWLSWSFNAPISQWKQVLCCYGGPSGWFGSMTDTSSSNNMGSSHASNLWPRFLHRMQYCGGSLRKTKHTKTGPSSSSILMPLGVCLWIERVVCILKSSAGIGIYFLGLTTLTRSQSQSRNCKSYSLLQMYGRSMSFSHIWQESEVR